jgi:hypothetical protein
MIRLKKTVVAIVLALPVASFATYADTINLDTIVLSRLQAANALGEVYRRSAGTPLPEKAIVSTKFIGTTTGRMEYLANRSVTPKLEVIDMARVQNCNELPTKTKVILGKKREDSFSLTNSDTVETSVSVSVDVTAPFASAKSELKQSWSATTTRAQSTSQAVDWGREDEIPVAAGKELLTQLVLDTSSVSGQYKVPIVMKGDVMLRVLAPAMPYQWKGVSDKRVPGDAIAAGKEAGQVLQICMLSAMSATPVVGKVWKGGCEVAKGLTLFPYHFIASKYQILTGNPATMQWMSAADFSASGKAMYEPYAGAKTGVCLAKHGADEVPGHLVDNVCRYTTGDKARATTDYKVLMPASIEKQTTFKLEDHLNELQRTVDIKGSFAGSAGSSVSLRIGKPAAIKPEDCLSSEQGSTANVNTSAAVRPPNSAALRLPAASKVTKLPVNSSTALIPLDK